MKPGELSWYRLRFPRELSADAVVAALSGFSGVAHRTRLVFDLNATSTGIEHRLAVSPTAVDVVSGNLRAAIPSLRLDQVDAPKQPHSRRLLWQLAPATAASRADALSGVTASFLASLFPLAEHETIRLLWTVRPSARPPLPFTPENRREGYLRALRPKLALPGLAGHGELRVTARSAERTAQLLHRPTAVLRSLG